jgi:hypothetical protein
VKKFLLFALTAGAMFSVCGPASAQGIYLDLGGDGLVAIATMTARVIRTTRVAAIGTTTARVTATGTDTAIAETAASIAPTPRDSRRLTDAKMAGPCKTASANHTGATDRSASLRHQAPPYRGAFL